MEVHSGPRTPPHGTDDDSGMGSPGSVSCASTPPHEGVWDDDDQALMDLLMAADDELPLPLHRRPLAATKVQKAKKVDKIKSENATTKTTKGKLSATERRAKHREVVRRSYHRNKQTISELKKNVQALEEQFRALTMHQSKAVESERVRELKSECAALDATSEEYRKESVRLQQLLLRHEEYTRVIQECFADENEESTSDEDDPMEASWSGLSSPATSEEDFSPDKRKRVFRAIDRPTHVVDIAPPARVDRVARREVGFVPLSSYTAKQLVTRIYEGIVHFTLSGHAVSTGAAVLGWEDKRLVEDTNVKFALRKSFLGSSSYELMAKTWQCFSDPDCVHHKFRGLMEIQILQHVNDDTIIALRDNVSPDGSKLYRCVFLLFRMRTNRGFLIGTRSLDDPHVVDKASCRISKNGLEIQWIDMNGWFLFDRDGYLEPSSYFRETGAQVEYGGQMDYGDRTHVSTLVMDTLSTVLKWETFVLGPLFTLPPSSTD